MKTTVLYALLALISGALIPIQAATNTSFSKAAGNPIITGVMVFGVGLVGMLTLTLIMRSSWPSLNQVGAAPLYSYVGGLIIATYVVIITFIVPRIGVGPAIGLVVTGQILCAVAIDHFGLFNVQIRSVDSSRLMGVGLMIVGVYIVMKK